MTPFVRVGGRLLPRESVREIDIARLETSGIVLVYTLENDAPVELRDAEAIDLVMRVAPSILEGKRFRWIRSAWALHNLVGHPLLQLLAWAGQTRLGLRVHDATIPRPRRPDRSRPARDSKDRREALVDVRFGRRP
jgi:hypothetical protein